MLKGEQQAPERLLFWWLQGQVAVLKGGNKLITLGHRPAQLFRPADDPGERKDRAAEDTETMAELYQDLGRWQSLRPTMPLWGSSPY